MVLRFRLEFVEEKLDERVARLAVQLLLVQLGQHDEEHAADHAQGADHAQKVDGDVQKPVLQYEREEHAAHLHHADLGRILVAQRFVFNETKTTTTTTTILKTFPFSKSKQKCVCRLTEENDAQSAEDAGKYGVDDLHGHLLASVDICGGEHERVASALRRLRVDEQQRDEHTRGQTDIGRIDARDAEVALGQAQLSDGHLSDAHARGADEHERDADGRLDQLAVRVIDYLVRMMLHTADAAADAAGDIGTDSRRRRRHPAGHVEMKDDILELDEILLDAEQERRPHDEHHAGHVEHHGDHVSHAQLLVEHEARYDGRYEHARVVQRLHVAHVHVANGEEADDDGRAADDAARDQQRALLAGSQIVQAVLLDEEEHDEELDEVADGRQIAAVQARTHLHQYVRHAHAEREQDAEQVAADGLEATHDAHQRVQLVVAVEWLRRRRRRRHLGTSGGRQGRGSSGGRVFVLQQQQQIDLHLLIAFVRYGLHFNEQATSGLAAATAAAAAAAVRCRCFAHICVFIFFSMIFFFFFKY